MIGTIRTSGEGVKNKETLELLSASIERKGEGLRVSSMLSRTCLGSNLEVWRESI